MDDRQVRERVEAHAHELMTFLDESPCSYHAVEAMRKRFEDAGFRCIDEREPFSLSPRGRYCLVRNGSAFVAFVVGTDAPSRAGFRMLGAHTDSPTFRIKPRPEVSGHGVVHLGVEVYGGPLRVSWMDRDLGICGRAVVEQDDGSLQARTFQTDHPVVTLPNLAIHMNRSVNDEGLAINPQTQLTPILGTAAGEGAPEGVRTVPTERAFNALVARLIGVDPGRIVDCDAYLYDTQRASLGGWDREFLRSGRIDDLAMCFAGMRALLDAADDPCPATRLLVCYDSEEIGSQTPQGARSNLLPHVLERIALSCGDDREAFLASLSRSLLVSADNAHVVHPGYADKSEPNHAPVLNGGPVLKVHASRAYATDATAAAVFELACRRAEVPCQRFVNRSDARSGGTIGSMTAAQLGVPTADVGAAQFAMHSIRETAGIWDIHYMIRAMGAFFELPAQVDINAR